MVPYLEARSLTKTFGALAAVNDISFSLEKGMVLGLAGPNGSGKSTLFNIMTKIPFGATSGELYLEGVPMHTLSNVEIARRGIIRTFQRETVFSSLSCVDNILVALEQTLGIRGKEAEWLSGSLMRRLKPLVFPETFIIRQPEPCRYSTKNNS